jgi:Fur family zinc uptake transcriptional regulator
VNAATFSSPFKPRRHRHQRCVDDALSGAEQLCAGRGLKLTPLRRRVLELIWSRHEPARAYDILEQLDGEGRSGAPPTVYRALEFLLANGLVHRIQSLNAYVGCGEPATAHAGQFLICRACNAVGELDDPEIEALIAGKAGATGFDVERQTIEIMGLCPDCSDTDVGLDADAGAGHAA